MQNNTLMTDTSTPRKRRWWLVPLALVMLAALLVADIYLLKPTIEKLSWKLASRNFDGWDIDATSEDNIVLVGNRILHYNGLFWYRGRSFSGRAIGHKPVLSEYAQEMNFDWPATQWFEPYLNDVDAYDDNHIYAVGKAGILRYNGFWWSSMPVVEGLVPHPYEIWAQNPDSVYALDEELGALYWDGKQWDTLSLPLQGELDISAIGGTDECMIITGSYKDSGNSDNFVLIRENDTWHSADISSLDDGIELSSYNDGPLEFDHVWGGEDGRIIVSLAEPLRFPPFLDLSCRRLLCYDQDVWSFFEAPDQTFYNAWWFRPLYVSIDEQGCLLVYTEDGERMRQITDETGNRVWQSIDEEDTPFSGVGTLLDNETLLIYGGESERVISTAGTSLVEPPCYVNKIELTW